MSTTGSASAVKSPMLPIFFSGLHRMKSTSGLGVEHTADLQANRDRIGITKRQIVTSRACVQHRLSVLPDFPLHQLVDKDSMQRSLFVGQ
jgi:hypothetical protein